MPPVDVILAIVSARQSLCSRSRKLCHYCRAAGGEQDKTAAAIRAGNTEPSITFFALKEEAETRQPAKGLFRKVCSGLTCIQWEDQGDGCRGSNASLCRGSAGTGG